MAERSKALVSGTSLFGGGGSNPPPIIIFCCVQRGRGAPTVCFGRVLVGWPSGPRRQFKALVSSEAGVRIPLQSFFYFLCPVFAKMLTAGIEPAIPGS